MTAENSRNFGYDVRNRLVSSTGPNASYSYSAASDLTTVSVPTGTTSTMAYDAAHQLASLNLSPAPATGPAYSFSYDPQGNRTSKKTPQGVPVASYAYDQANRLIASGAYAYDGDGLRTTKTGVEQGTFTWDVAEGLPLLLHDGTNAYVSGPGGLPLEQIDATGRVLYYHGDQLGSTRLLTDATGAVAASYEYDPYGNQTSTTTTSPTIVNPLRFAGQYTDAETGFVYLRARYYDPATGKFLTKDPVATKDRVSKGVGRAAAHVVKHAGVQVNACVGYVAAYCGSVGVNYKDGFTASHGGGHGLGWTGPSIGGTWQSGPTASRGDCHSGGVGPGGAGICYGGHRQYVADVGFGTGGYFHTDYRTHSWKPWR